MTDQAKNRSWLYALTVVSATALGWLLSRQFRALDREVFERLMLAFGFQEAELSQAATASLSGDVFYIASVVVVSVAAFFAGLKLSFVPRIAAWVQLFAVTLLLQWCLWFLFKEHGHPIAYFGALTLSCLGGYVFRWIEQRDRKFESQYYEIVLRNKELQETRLQIVKQDEVERRLLAADLHDQVLNDLKALKQKIEDYRSEPRENVASDMDKLLHQAMNQIREVMDSLCPSALEHLGLVAAMEDCLRRGSERGNFKARFKSRLEGNEVERLSMVEQSLLYRLVQESVTNICKHARASIVRGTLEKEGDQLVVRITDDGKGIEAGQLNKDSRGLRYMRQRADLIGATIAWRPGENGKGTLVEIRLDLAGRNGSASSDS